MTHLEAFLYFATPPLSLRDIRLALRFELEYGTRPGFLTILETQSRSFDNATQVLSVLKEYYGPKENTSGQNETPTQALQKAIREEKAFRAIPYKEKEKIFQVKKKFGARLI